MTRRRWAILAAFVVAAGCGNPNWRLTSGQVQSITERPDGMCDVVIQAYDPLVIQDPNTITIRCADAIGVLPGDRWPPERDR